MDQNIAVIPTYTQELLSQLKLSEVELLPISDHFSYACAAHGMFCLLSYVQVTSP